MKITKRDRWVLHTLLDHSIVRYLIVNSFGRHDGNEKANYHIHISRILCRFIFAEGNDYHESLKVLDSWSAVHDYLAEILTDRLDESIGFPLDKAIYGDAYAIFEERFFNVLIDNIDNIENVARESIKNLNF
jgi:hypothetical protein